MHTPHVSTQNRHRAAIDSVLLRWLYSLCIYLMLPFAYARLWWRGRKAPLYRQGWKQRLGFVDKPKTHGLWVHAASLGEVIAADILLKRMWALKPDLTVIITTMTISGAIEVKKRFGDKVQHTYVPYDTPDAVKRFLRAVQPLAGVLIETELWPNLLHTCQKKHIPLFLANARLSEKSYRGYKRMNRLFKPLWPILHVAAQTDIEAERFQHLGVPATQVTVTGSLKFDIQLNPQDFERATYFREIFGKRQQVWLAASTHDGEERIVLDAFAHVLAQCPDALLVIAPRHPERFQQVADLIAAAGYVYKRRSLGEAATPETQVFLQDSMGELLHTYGACDIAYVGGSLVPIGGHNVLEPAAFAVPSITGPHTFNFLEITRMLHAAKGLKTVTDANTLADAVIQAFAFPQERLAAGELARQVVAKNRGSVIKQGDILMQLIKC